jgi:UPF0755 protein
MKKVLIALILFLVIIVAAAAIFLKNNLSAPSSDTKNKIFVINTGEGIVAISKSLEKNNLIKNQYAFLAYTFLTGQNKKIQSGTFRLSSSFTVPEVVKKLSSGGVSDYWLKIIDGFRVEEIATLFPEGLPFTSKDFLTQVKSKEGYIYPDSYLLPQYYTLDQTLEVINQNFNQKFAKAKADATNTTMTDRQILILASIIEREARTLKVKEGVAGVLINRINTSMPLQSDVTIQYIRDSKTTPTKYWADISSADISIISPYNTYKNPGLPPGPICNPGYDSIYAAFHPTDSDYIFYLTGNDGVMHYARTLTEHNSNIAKYLK